MAKSRVTQKSSRPVSREVTVAIIGASAAIAVALIALIPYIIDRVTPPNPSKITNTIGVNAGTTGWIYVGTIKNATWIREGIENGPTINTSEKPQEGSNYDIILDVNLREALPKPPIFRMEPAKGIIRHGERVNIDSVTTLMNGWIWAKVTLLK